MKSLKFAMMLAVMAFYSKIPVPDDSVGAVLGLVFFLASLFFFCKSIGED